MDGRSNTPPETAPDRDDDTETGAPADGHRTEDGDGRSLEEKKRLDREAGDVADDLADFA